MAQYIARRLLKTQSCLENVEVVQRVLQTVAVGDETLKASSIPGPLL